MIALNINCTRINKDRIKAGKYLDLVLFTNKTGPDKFGYEGTVCESVSKEEREQGVKGGIIGNWKTLGQAKPAAAPQSSGPKTPTVDDDSDIPF